MRALAIAVACLALQACTQEDDLGKSAQAATAPVENAALDTIDVAPANGA